MCEGKTRGFRHECSYYFITPMKFIPATIFLYLTTVVLNAAPDHSKHAEHVKETRDARHARHVKHAKHAEFGEHAKHAEYTEYAKPAEYTEHTVHPVPEISSSATLLGLSFTVLAALRKKLRG
jgi:hypothetical protein